MAIRTWGRSLLVALGVSLLAGASQLGIAYGLGLLRFTRSFADVPGHWPAQLVWVGWLTVGATLIGAVLAERHARRDDLPVTAVVQATIAVAATLGATVVAPLCMLPARNAQVPLANPVLAVAVSALFGALVAAVAAVAVLRYAPVRWNVVATTATLWLFALLSVVPSLGAADPLRAVRLGTLDPTWLAPDTAGRLALVILPGMALACGAAVAGLERRHGRPPLLGIVSGVAGPVLVAVVYLLAGPGRGDDGYQSTPYRAALLAVLAGALGAAGAALLGRPPLTADNLLRWPPLGWGRSRSDAIAPTDILRPLPVDSGVPSVPSPRPTGETDPTPASTGLPPGPDASARSGPDPDPTPVSHQVPTGPDAPWGHVSGSTGAGAAGTSSVDTDREPAGRFPEAPRTEPGLWGAREQPGPSGGAEPGGLNWSLPTQGRHAADEGPARPPSDPTGSVVDTGPVGEAVPTGPAGSTGDQGDPTTGGLRRLRGLLRPDRLRGGSAAGDRPEADETALLPQDEEYVDWVAQLGQPDSAPLEPGERRTLRSTGRHQQD
ncbi:hypothetical protein GA0074692_6004 [Micromonospora pallida]|uniref:Uncharacterized protein n=1 Tax=Micromonospora pallida TaxID=145854 RepID=A0A1C6TGZ1_9ACTN|nr:hypothetical protein [Micromonospora pallida]SCL40832.1 hypothetical protein GA0074692_6004 [Micromonospora pallida]